MATFFIGGSPPEIKFFGHPQTLRPETYLTSEELQPKAFSFPQKLIFHLVHRLYQPLPQITLSWAEILDRPVGKAGLDTWWVY